MNCSSATYWDLTRRHLHGISFLFFRKKKEFRSTFAVESIIQNGAHVDAARKKTLPEGECRKYKDLSVHFSFKKLKTGKKSERVSVCQGMSEGDFINKSESVASNRRYTRSAFSAFDLCIP